MSVHPPDTDGRPATDKQLLFRFRKDRDEAAFTELVERYQALVLGVARQMLGCPHAAEDVFQATFLVLARDAGKIRDPAALANWLYGVAYRTAARAAKQRARQGVALKDDPMTTSSPLQEMSDRVEQQTVHDELQRLPEKVRAPMILRYLQGKSNAEVAAALQLSESAVEGRLKRGRNQLRLRLARQGVAFTAAAALLDLLRSPAAGVSPTLVSDTIAACLHPDGAIQAGYVREEVTHLAQQESMKMLTTMTTSKAVMLGCLAVSAVTLGWSAMPSGAGAQAVEVAGDNGEIQVAAPTSQDTPDPFEAKVNNLFGRASDGSPPTTAAAAGPRQVVGRFDLKRRTPAEVRIAEALLEPTRMEFDDAPLLDVVVYLRQVFDIQIEFDGPALEDVSVDPASDTVTKDLSGITLRSALRRTLDDYNLTYVIRDEVLLITTQEREEALRETRIYPRSDPEQFDQLVQVITSTVAPDSWDAVGGPGSITVYRNGLIIAQSQSVHEELNEFFAQLEALQELQAD